ncbi:MAG: hypothetical protein D6719_03575 [Candidatus Dadabacteria bacterium]|nr:MAG: hypothetical protein D6719_03575 [Candidatus Dadabacteria bacterium]
MVKEPHSSTSKQVPFSGSFEWTSARFGAKESHAETASINLKQQIHGIVNSTGSINSRVRRLSRFYNQYSGQFARRHIVTMLWGLGQLADSSMTRGQLLNARKIVEPLTARLLKQLPEFADQYKPETVAAVFQSVSNLRRWGMRNIRASNEETLEGLAEYAREHLDNFSVRQLARILRSAADLRVGGTGLNNKAIDVLLKRSRQFSRYPNSCVICFEALASQSSRAFRRVWLNYAGKLDLEKLTEQNLMRLYHALLAAKRPVPDLLSQRVDGIIKKKQENMPRPNSFERDVERHVHKLAPKDLIVVAQALVEGYRVDLLLMREKQPGIVIECDGDRFHYMVNSAGRVMRNGRSRLKDKVLRATGHDILRVKYSSWKRMSDSKRREFLRKELKKLGVEF